MSFYAHGSLHFSIEGNIQIIKGTGPWNLESIKNSENDAAEVHKKLYGKNWVVLAIIDGQPIHTPDAAALLEEAVKKDKQNGRIASALILNGSENPDFGRNHIASIYKNAGENFEFFSDISSAKEWLKKQLDNS